MTPRPSKVSSMMRSSESGIVVDAEHFHLPLPAGRMPLEDRLRFEYVERVIQYWRDELEDQPYSRLEPNYPKVATQTFVFGPCTDDTDVRFQFGVLTKAQMDGLKALGQDPRELISIAVRTSYDRVSLRGRGFVYIAADSGELRPNEAAMTALPWARGSGGLLLKALAHEVGHVFGVPHTTPDSEIDPTEGELMDPSYPEALVVASDGAIGGLAKADIPSFFSSSSYANWSTCAMPGQALSDATIAFLGAPAGTRCLTSAWDGRTVEIYGDEQKKQHLGTLTLLDPESDLVGYTTNWETPMRLWLPPEQQVYQPNRQPTGSGLTSVLRIGSLRNTRHFLGDYKSDQGNVHSQMILTQSPGLDQIDLAGITARGLMPLPWL